MTLRVMGRDENVLEEKHHEFTAVSEKTISINISSSISISSSSNIAGISMFLVVTPQFSSMRVLSSDDGGATGRSWIVEWRPSREMTGVSAEFEIGLWRSGATGFVNRLGAVNITVHVLPCLTSVRDG